MSGTPEPDLKVQAMLPFIPSEPDSEPPEWRRAMAAVQTLQARLPRLLFAAPRDAQGVETLTRLAKGINYYLEVAGTSLRETGRGGAAKTAGPYPKADARDRHLLIAEDVEQLVSALDVFLADPDAADRHAALEEAVHQVTDHLTDRFHARPGPLPPPGADPASAGSPGGEPPPAPHPWRAAPEREAWWGLQLQRLRRQTRLAQGLSGIALVGLAISLFTDQGPLSGPEAWTYFGSPGQDSGRVAKVPGPGAAGDGHTSRAADPILNEAQTPNQIPLRLAELELELLHLKARLDALENQQEGTDRALARLQNAAEAPNPPAY